MIDVQTVLLWSMRISTVIGAFFVIGVSVYARSGPRQQSQRAEPAHFSGLRDSSWSLRPASYWQYIVATLVILWVQAEVRSARRFSVERVTEIKTQASQEIAAAYEAAAQPRVETPQNQGYVYLGQCDKQQWIPKTYLFGNLPRRCDEEVPTDGQIIVSWKGAVIRETPPAKVDGKPKFGSEVARVSAGYSVKLRKLVPGSVFSSGPQYYWGLVDFPTAKPER